MKKYFDLVKEHLESLFNPLRELLRQNAKATQNLCDRLMEIEKTYPQKFVHLNRQEPRCQKNEKMLFRHDSDIKVLKEKTSGFFSKN
jgi:hypothetical protein